VIEGEREIVPLGIKGALIGYWLLVTGNWSWVLEDKYWSLEVGRAEGSL